MAEQRRTQPPRAKSPPPLEEEDSDIPTETFRRESLVASHEHGDHVEPSAGPDQTMRDRERGDRPPIEIEFVQQRGVSIPQAMWGMLDIHTKNRVYRINSSMICIEVIERKTGARAKGHPMLGARMGGGQRRSGNVVEVADPLPVPGMDVVFKQPGGKFGQTSRVERVVLRVRVSGFRVGDREPSWEEITGQFSIDDLSGEER